MNKPRTHGRPPLGRHQANLSQEVLHPAVPFSSLKSSPMQLVLTIKCGHSANGWNCTITEQLTLTWADGSCKHLPEASHFTNTTCPCNQPRSYPLVMSHSLLSTAQAVSTSSTHPLIPLVSWTWQEQPLTPSHGLQPSRENRSLPQTVHTQVSDLPTHKLLAIGFNPHGRHLANSTQHGRLTADQRA